jgi:hypothetical protein
VPGATRYEVLVSLADRSQVFRVVRQPHAVLTDPFPSKPGTVSVDALDLAATRGPVSSVNLRPVPSKHHHP